MRGRGRRAATVATIIALSSLAADGVLPATRSSDEAALQPTRQAADRGIEHKVNSLVRRMTADEKLQQLQLSATDRSPTRMRAPAMAMISRRLVSCTPWAMPNALPLTRPPSRTFSTLASNPR
jgi:hypothetical protein